MPGYKRCSTQHSWSESNMKRAIEDVRNKKLSFNAAVKAYMVPKGTLHRRTKLASTASDAAKKRLGRFKTTFTTEQEAALVKHIFELEKRFFGLTISDFRRLAFQYAEKNQLDHRFNKEKGVASRVWVNQFLKRNKTVSLRQGENTSIARAIGFNKPCVNQFFDLLQSLLEKHRFKPHRIYNCDEKGITTVPNKPPKILSMKGKKQVGVISTAERGTLITVEFCISAGGQFIPPLLIFPRVRKVPAFENGLPPGSVAVAHQSGWMQADIFSNWLDHFIHYTKPTMDDPVLLILDGHATHTKNLDLLEKARKNFVHILVLPPHTSHRLQPLDVGFMFPLSAAYGQGVKSWFMNNPGRAFSIHDVSPVFGSAFLKVATAETAVNAFKATGIWPFNRAIFPDEVFAAAETTDRPLVAPSAVNPLNATPASLNDCSISETPVSPEDIWPLPKSCDVGKRASNGSKRGKTAILTDSPYVNELKGKAGPPRAKKAALPRRELFPSSQDGETSDSEPEVTNLCDDDLSDWIEEDSDVDDEGLQKELKVLRETVVAGHYVLVELMGPKNHKEKFVAVILEKNDDQIKVSFMKKYRSHNDIFHFPDIPDISHVEEGEILGRLEVKETMRRGQILFVMT